MASRQLLSCLFSVPRSAALVPDSLSCFHAGCRCWGPVSSFRWDILCLAGWKEGE